jgi:hypothetical protein
MALTNTNRKGIADSIKNWSARKNLDDALINDFIELALSKANRALRIPPLENFTFMNPDTNGLFTLPSNFIEVKELSYEREGKVVTLERKAIHEVEEQLHVSSLPCFFARLSNTIQVAPYGQGEPTQLRLYYYYALPPLSSDSSENWFTLYAPEILLYGGLAELSSYTRDPESEQRWNAKFNEAVGVLQAMEDRAEWKGSVLGISLQGST